MRPDSVKEDSIKAAVGLDFLISYHSPERLSERSEGIGTAPTTLSSAQEENTQQWGVEELLKVFG